MHVYGSWDCIAWEKPLHNIQLHTVHMWRPMKCHKLLLFGGDTSGKFSLIMPDVQLTFRWCPIALGFSNPGLWTHCNTISEARNPSGDEQHHLEKWTPRRFHFDDWSSGGHSSSALWATMMMWLNKSSSLNSSFICILELLVISLWGRHCWTLVPDVPPRTRYMVSWNDPHTDLTQYYKIIRNLTKLNYKKIFPLVNT